ncbi:MAG: ribonuclease J [Bacilli bacterium]|nr:ribonuclease J [Bacilli bacterium]
MERLNNPISIYALGGLGEVGKNMYCIEDDKSIIIIDCGVRFPSIDLPGIDYIIPDFTHLKNNRNKVKALIITHGHEDHIGAIPFLVQVLNVPVIYAPRLAAALIKHKLEDNRIREEINIVEYTEKTKIEIMDFFVSFFRVTHSIPDSFGVVVDTPQGRVVSTGDFKVDLTPIGPDIELVKMARLGSEGIDLLLSDSTNAENEGFTPSEKNVYDSIVSVFENTEGRLIVSTFSSNISRIQQICEVALNFKRKICIIGRSMEKAVQISRSFGYIKVPDSEIIMAEDVKLYKNSELLILCTGSQGEPMAQLARIANGEHKDIHIIPGDTVVFSSSAIPGNGMMIEHVVNLLTRSGADVVTNSILGDIHSSGHPSKQELRLVLKLMKPKYFMPMHGEHRMLRIHGEIAEEVGVPHDHIFILDNGNVLNLFKHKVSRGYDVESGATYIDGKDVDGLAPTVLADRRILTQDGMMTVIVMIDSVSNTLMDEPIFYNKGIITKNSESAEKECKELITKAVKKKLLSKTNYADIKTIIKDVATDYIFKRTNRKPMIIPVILTKDNVDISK